MNVSDAMNPSNPMNPSKPTGPIDPIDPTDPTNPNLPNAPSKPMNLDDPRISAYLMPDASALSDADRTAVEAALAADPRLAEAVADLRSLTERLEAHYQSAASVDDADLMLDEGRRAAIAAEESRPPVRVIDLTRWERQPLLIRIAAFAAAFWLLGLPMMRWGAAQVLYRTGLGRGIVMWMESAKLSAGHDNAAKVDGEYLVEQAFGNDGPPGLLDFVMRRDNDALPFGLSSRPAEVREPYSGAAADSAQDPGSGLMAQMAPATAPAGMALGGYEGASPGTGEYRIPPTYDSSGPDSPYPVQPPADLPTSPGGEGYQSLADNPFKAADQEPLSTFSIDVDSASYANTRRYIQELGQLPPVEAVRIEELINSFRYDDAPPPADGPDPFAVHVELGPAPWQPRHQLLRIALKGKEIPPAARPDVNLVFLIDVSGSMQDTNKLPLVKESLAMLVEQLGERDRVSIVVYAGSSGLVLPPTRGDERRRILAAIGQLEAGGSTNGGEGIQLAYRLAREQYVEGGANRVILLTDGDFNVGITDHGSLEQLIAEEARSGVFLSVLGFGMGNLQDDTLELLADKGNGNYGYIDGLDEARRLLVEQLSGTLVTIAKDVKIQLEFNPRAVGWWRQIGYENRALAARDFDDDRKDAGEIGAGHSVVALYELVPAGEALDAPGQGQLRYGNRPSPVPAGTGLFDRRAGDPASDELLYLKLRYKQPDGLTSRLLESPVRNEPRRAEDLSVDFRFSAAVAAYGLLLRQSPFRGEATWDLVDRLAAEGLGRDPEGYRSDFRELARQAARMSR